MTMVNSRLWSINLSNLLWGRLGCVDLGQRHLAGFSKWTIEIAMRFRGKKAQLISCTAHSIRFSRTFSPPDLSNSSSKYGQLRDSPRH